MEVKINLKTGVNANLKEKDLTIDNNFFINSEARAKARKARKDTLFEKVIRTDPYFFSKKR